MHPAEHRGLRELHAAARQLRVHWRELGRRLDAVGFACEPLGEGSDDAAELLDGWAVRMRVREDALRKSAIACGDDPATAITVATPGLAGRAGHAVAAAVGTAGEWVDGRLKR